MQNARKQAINLYAHNSWESFLSKFKFWEEPYEVVDEMLPRTGTILDLGCGEGLLSNFLALSCPKRQVIGYELAPERLERAQKGLQNTSFQIGDIVNSAYPKADAVVIFHVLHHLSSKNAQEKVLLKAKNTLNKNGKLIIVEVHVKPTIKYLAAFIADHFLVPWAFEKRFFTRAYFRKEEEWLSLLKQMDFKIKVREETKGRPFPNIIFECSLS